MESSVLQHVLFQPWANGMSSRLEDSPETSVGVECGNWGRNLANHTVLLLFICAAVNMFLDPIQGAAYYFLSPVQLLIWLLGRPSSA